MLPSQAQVDLFAAAKPKPGPLVTKVIGLDMSLTSTAVAVLSPQGEPIEFSNFGYELTGTDERQRIERVIGIANSVVGMVKKHCDLGKAAVGIEGYAFGKMFRREALAELQGFTKPQLFLALGVVVQPIPSGAARKAAGIIVKQKTVRKKVDGKWVKEKQEKVKPVKEQVREQLEERGLKFPPKGEGGEDQMDAYVVARAMWLKLTQGAKNG